MLRLLAAIGTIACVTASGAVAQSNKQSWNDLLKPYDAKTKPSGPVATPVPTPAPAQPTLQQAVDTGSARVFVIVTLYDSKCDTLPKTLMSKAERLVVGLSMQTLKTETADLLERYKNLGMGAWCVEMKPTVNLIMKAWADPT